MMATDAGGRARLSLRVGIIQGGRLIEERMLEPGRKVTIGQAPRNSFIVSSPDLPTRYQLFGTRAGQPFLRFNPAMDGRLAGEHGVKTLAELARGSGAARVGDEWEIPLGPAARGKVALGEVSVLFQLLEVPPRRPRAVLPASLRGSLWSRVEPALGGVIGGSACLAVIFLALVSLADFPDDATRDQAIRRNLPATMKRARTPPMRATASAPGGESGPGVETIAKRGEGPRRRSRAAAKKKAGSEAVSRLRRSDPRYQRMLDGLIPALHRSADDVFGRHVIGRKCRGECRQAITGDPDAFRRGFLTPSLDGRASQPNVPGVLSFPGARRPRASIARAGRGTGVRAAMAPRVLPRRAPMRARKIRGRVRLGVMPKPMVARAPHQLGRRIKRKAYSLRWCYEQALAVDPTLTGTVTISFTILPNGRVTGVIVRTPLPERVAACVRGRVTGWLLGSVGESVFYRFQIRFRPGG